MAVSKDITITNGLTIPNAYIKVQSLFGDKNQITYTVAAFVDSTDDYVLKTEQFTFKPSENENAERWDKQCYVDLKTRGGYENSIDV